MHPMVNRGRPSMKRYYQRNDTTTGRRRAMSPGADFGMFWFKGQRISTGQRPVRPTTGSYAISSRSELNVALAGRSRASISSPREQADLPAVCDDGRHWTACPRGMRS